MKSHLSGASLLVLLALAPSTRADETQEQCLTGYDQGQRLSLEGKLQAAREQLLICARPGCPSVAQSDCAKWLAELETKQPTVIVTATASGKDLEDVRVSVDGALLCSRLDGRPLPVDPGPHTFRYESAGNKVIEERLVIVEGEKRRRLTPRFESSAPPAPPPQQSPRFRGVPGLSWGLGVVAVAALGTFTGFALAGKSVESCVPSCTRDEVDSFRRDYLIADVSLGVGVISAAVAVYLAITAGRSTAGPARMH